MDEVSPTLSDHWRKKAHPLSLYYYYEEEEVNRTGYRRLLSLLLSIHVCSSTRWPPYAAGTKENDKRANHQILREHVLLLSMGVVGRSLAGRFGMTGASVEPKIVPLLDEE